MGAAFETHTIDCTGRAQFRPHLQRCVKILATGSYVPRTTVASTDIDARLGKRAGWTQRLFGIEKRHFAASDESTSFMAAEAGRDAQAV